jgi:two-component system NarL family response regulator
MPSLYLCDDQSDYRTLLRAVLTREEGMDIVGEGGDGESCLRDAARQQPDVVLLDVNMPGISGLEALPRLRQAVPDSVVLVLSTASAEEYEEIALQRGATGYIQKPRNILELPAIIRHKLETAGLAP